MRLDEIIPVDAQEMLITAGFSMTRGEVKLEDNTDFIDIDSELRLIGNRQIAEHLTSYMVDDKVRFRLGNDAISMTLVGKRVVIKLGGYTLTGAKKGIILDRVIKHSVIVDQMVDEQWIMYTVVFNGKPYRIGKMKESDAWFMSKLITKPSTQRDYYKLWQQRRTQAKYKAMGIMETEHEVYGSAEQSLGSVFTDQVEDEMLEAIQTILQYKDTHIGATLVADLIDTLGVYDD